MIYRNGIATYEEIAKVLPAADRLARGPVAIIECFQEIPCDPCYGACPKGAIMPFENINDLPKMDFSICDGCGLCVAACPGIAIFVVDMAYGAELALLKLPHEFLPLPKKGEIVKLLDRSGKVVAQGEIIRSIRYNDKTCVVWVTVPKELALDIRAIAPPAYEDENPLRAVS